MSTGTSCSSNWRIFSTVKPPETTIFTCWKPSRSRARRTFQTSRGFTPVGLKVPISGITDLSTRVSAVSIRTPYSRDPSARATLSEVPTQSLSKSTSVMSRTLGSISSANFCEASAVSPWHAEIQRFQVGERVVRSFDEEHRLPRLDFVPVVQGGDLELAPVHAAQLEDRDGLIDAAEERVRLAEHLHRHTGPVVVLEEQIARAHEVLVGVVALPHPLDGEVED